MNMKTTIAYSGRKIFSYLCGAIILSFALYSFAIASVTVHISDMQALDSDIENLRTEIAELERDYFTMVNNLTLNEALELGFTQDEYVSFAYVNKAQYVALNN